MAIVRLTRQDWITIARKALIASGVDDVKVDVLARRLKVTRGSFYWHFKHRQELLDALLEDWEASNRAEIAVVEKRAAEGATGSAEMFQIWLNEDRSFPAFDLAIRGWARKSRDVAKVMGEIDAAWVTLLQSFFESGGMTAPESFVRARVIYFHQIGYHALSISESIEDRILLAPYYHLALFGSPAPADLEDSLRAAMEKPRSARSKARKKVLAESSTG